LTPTVADWCLISDWDPLCSAPMRGPRSTARTANDDRVGRANDRRPSPERRQPNDSQSCLGESRRSAAASGLHATDQSVSKTRSLHGSNRFDVAASSPPAPILPNNIASAAHCSFKSPVVVLLHLQSTLLLAHFCYAPLSCILVKLQIHSSQEGEQGPSFISWEGPLTEVDNDVHGLLCSQRSTRLSSNPHLNLAPYGDRAATRSPNSIHLTIQLAPDTLRVISALATSVACFRRACGSRSQYLGSTRTSVSWNHSNGRAREANEHFAGNQMLDVRRGHRNRITSGACLRYIIIIITTTPIK
jgi:hypothetical protein